MFARLTSVLRLWFTFEMPVRRRAYLLSGLFLFAVKFVIDSAIVRGIAGQPWSPLSYLDPFFFARHQQPLGAGGAGWLLALVMIPFVWVGVSLTVRRALDAGASPLLAFLFFLPCVNYLLMIALAFMPSSATRDKWTDRPASPQSSRVKVVFGSAAGGAGVGLVAIAVSVLLLERYGVALFIGAPFVLGALSAYLYNRHASRPFRETVVIVTLSLALAMASMLLFALEGLICIAMAAPLAFVLALLGGVLGRSVAALRGRPAAPVTAMLFALPVLTVAPLEPAQPPEHVVLTTIEAAAPAAVVWRHVVEFTELPPPDDALFKAGIAYPVRARIVGRGVGAVRTCEFSTGPFVEPITAWDPPARLAFDVTSQPPSMDELSPYRRVLAPHVVDGFLSRRGEFRMIPLGDGRTRIEGRTWYVLDIWPQWYWRPIADGVVHRIHRRVLEHVKDLAEEEAGDLRR